MFLLDFFTNQNFVFFNADTRDFLKTIFLKTFSKTSQKLFLNELMNWLIFENYYWLQISIDRWIWHSK